MVRKNATLGVQDDSQDKIIGGVPEVHLPRRLQIVHAIQGLGRQIFTNISFMMDVWEGGLNFFKSLA